MSTVVVQTAEEVRFPREGVVLAAGLYLAEEGTIDDGRKAYRIELVTNAITGQTVTVMLRADQRVMRVYDLPKEVLPMDFSEALHKVKAGARIRREGWNGHGMNVHLVTPIGPPALPYLEMQTAQGDLVPWLASQTDLLAEDWRVV